MDPPPAAGGAATGEAAGEAAGAGGASAITVGTDAGAVGEPTGTGAPTFWPPPFWPPPFWLALKGSVSSSETSRSGRVGTRSTIDRSVADR
ncbi:hypothetical protein [Azospirillum baldaniorum]|uniref:hypothetical protein n=1 Tax=Azospirillum baldaniorum TaxID=1064539 RepID=UPI001FCB37D6|nr:hypothetical protein [Azospirillum baldaniorum]